MSAFVPDSTRCTGASTPQTGQAAEHGGHDLIPRRRHESATLSDMLDPAVWFWRQLIPLRERDLDGALPAALNRVADTLVVHHQSSGY
jgi:hypothetical protein